MVRSDKNRKSWARKYRGNSGYIQRREHGWFGPEHEKILKGKIKRIGLDKISRSLDF